MSQSESCDVMVIGSGAAGLSLALTLAERHRVVVLSKGVASEGATVYAQGGVSAVMDHADAISSHIEDTLIAGAGLCLAGDVLGLQCFGEGQGLDRRQASKAGIAESLGQARVQTQAVKIKIGQNAVSHLGGSRRCEERAGRLCGTASSSLCAPQESICARRKSFSFNTLHWFS